MLPTLAIFIFYYFIPMGDSWLVLAILIAFGDASINVMIGGFCTSNEFGDASSSFSVYLFLKSFISFLGFLIFPYISKSEPKFYLIPCFALAVFTWITSGVLGMKLDLKSQKKETNQDLDKSN